MEAKQAIDKLTPEERAELAKIRKENLTGMSEERFRYFVALLQKERGVEVEA